MANDVYDKLTPERKMLVDMVLENLENSSSIWSKGWQTRGTPESIKGSRYKGINNLVLTLISLMRGYDDNRWVTFNQMKKNEWHFKTDEEGKSLAKGAGITIEYYELRDKETKQPFDKATLLGMDMDEKQEYMEENVYPIRKYYRVFNGDLIDGIPAKEIMTIDESERNDRAEGILKIWNDEECEIKHGGNHAFYNIGEDKIHLPKRESFITLADYYSTALHEVGHATGHKDRLNRDMSGGFGSKEYALEELRAEIASFFISQDLGLPLTENAVENSSAYLKSWKEKITDEPNVLFTSIADAEKISRFVLTKDRQNAVVYEAEKVVEERSEEYLKPSEIVAKNTITTEDKMVGRGVETLNRMSDRDVVDKASKTKSGDKFLALYNGGSIFGDKARDERSLMSRIAIFSGGDKEQVLRVYLSSGQYDNSKSSEHYDKLASQSLDFVKRVESDYKSKFEPKIDSSFGSKNYK